MTKKIKYLFSSLAITSIAAISIGTVISCSNSSKSSDNATKPVAIVIVVIHLL